MDHDACRCGLVVFDPAELDPWGACIVCAGSGHEWGCACLACSVYVVEVDAGADLGDALTVALGGIRKRD